MAENNIEFISATKLIQDGLCPYKRKHDKYEETDILRFGKAVDAGISKWLRGENFAEVFAKTAAESGLPLSDEYLNRANKCFETLKSADEDWLKLNHENIICIQSDDGEAEYYGNKYFELKIGKTWGLRGALDYADQYGLNEQGEMIQDLFDFDNIKKHVIRIIDWKTGFTEADDLQTAIYALVTWMKYEYLRDIYTEQGIETVIETRFFYLDQGGKSPKRIWNKDNLVSAYRYIETRVKEFLARKQFPKTLNKYCGYCGLNAGCEVYQKSLATPPVITGIEINHANFAAIIEQLEKMKAIEKIAKAAKEQLEEARNGLLLPLGKEGFVCGDKHYVATEKTTGYDYDLPSIFDAVAQLIERPPFEIMKFNSGAYDELMKDQKNAVIKKALTQLKKDHSTPTGSAIKVTSKINQFAEEIENDQEQPEPLAITAPTTPAESHSPEITDAEIVTEPAPDQINQMIEASKELTEAVDNLSTKPRVDLNAYSCSECHRVMWRKELPESCQDCGNPCLNCFLSVEDMLKTMREGAVIVCMMCGCVGDPKSITAPGKCIFCGNLGPWKTIEAKEEIKETQRQIVAAAKQKTSPQAPAEDQE